MSSTLFAIKTSDPKGRPYSIKITREDSSEGILYLAFSMSQGDESRAGDQGDTKLKFNTTSGTLTITWLDIPTGDIVCIGSCSILKLAGHVLDCWKSGKRTPDEIWECLKSKGYTIAQDTLECVASCLS